MELSLIDQVRALPEEKQFAFIDSLSFEDQKYLKYNWLFTARPKQQEPAGDWLFWWVNAGRGFGKTRTGAEFIRNNVLFGNYGKVALVGKNASDVRELMIEGPAGIITISAPNEKPVYSPSRKRLEWPNGAIGSVYYGSEPDSLRGPEHDIAWADELASWAYPDETFDNLEMGLRVNKGGRRPKGIITTTPRPIKKIKELCRASGIITTNGSTYENAGNLPASFINRMREMYEGTRIGRQELHAEILDDNPGALWRREWLDRDRVKAAPELKRIIIAIDPEATNTPNSAETGIIAAGQGYDGFYYVLEDLSIKDTPARWGAQAVAAYNKYHADRIIGETNNGGEMVKNTIISIQSNVPFTAVHASRGKVARAEPVSALYEQGKVKHVGFFRELEDQLCEWVPGDRSPDRLDALVWAISFLSAGFTPSAYGPNGEKII